MPNDSLLPGQHGELVSQDLRPTRWWYAWFQRVNARVLSAETTAQAASDAVAAIPASEAVTITEGPGIDVYGEHPSFRVEVKPDVLANLGRQGVPGRDGEDGQDSYVPGPKGDKGDTGASGQTIIIREEHYEESWPVVPQAAASASGGSTPTGTGFRHVTSGVEDGAASLVYTADINNDQVTYAKIQNVSAASKLLGRGSASGSGDVEEITLGSGLSMSGTTITANAVSSASYLAGSADIPPVSANAKDDEFDGTSSVTWTSTPTAPNTWNINSTRPGHAYLKASGSGNTIVGKYQAAPASYPYTVIVKVASTGRANYHRCGGIILIPASPTGSSPSDIITSAYDAGLYGHGVQRIYSSAFATFGSSSTKYYGVGGGPWYLKVVVTSATTYSSYYATDGWAYALIESRTTPFNIANIGVACSEEGAGGGVEAYFEFFRVT